MKKKTVYVETKSFTSVCTTYNTARNKEKCKGKVQKKRSSNTKTTVNVQMVTGERGEQRVIKNKPMKDKHGRRNMNQKDRLKKKTNKRYQVYELGTLGVCGGMKKRKRWCRKQSDTTKNRIWRNRKDKK